MKKFASMLIAAAVVLGLSIPASARPPYMGVFKSCYVEKSDNEAFKKAVNDEAKCNVCHMGEKKKDRNEYGVALSKILTKDKFDELKEDKEALNKFVAEALKKTESEKNAAGKTYGELIKAGQLPGGK